MKKGWSAGDNLFLMSRVDDLYDQTDRFLEFDTMSPLATVTHSYQSFKELWEPIMQASTHTKTIVDDNVEVITDDKMEIQLPME